MRTSLCLAVPHPQSIWDPHQSGFLLRKHSAPLFCPVPTPQHAEPHVTATIADLERQLAASPEEHSGSPGTFEAMATGVTAALLPAALAGSVRRGGAAVANGNGRA